MIPTMTCDVCGGTVTFETREGRWGPVRISTWSELAHLIEPDDGHKPTKRIK